MEAQKWYVFSFTLPKKPSRVRVSIWRKLKKAGAVNLAMGSWVLPALPECLAAFREVSEEVNEADGSVYLTESRYLQAGTDNELIDRFQDERIPEYEEFIEKCQGILDELAQETQLEEFDFIELEDNDTMAQRMILWLAQIQKRDYFHAPIGITAEEKWMECLSGIKDFEEKLYHFHGADIND